MRYTITINQYALSKIKSKLKFEEAALLDYIFWLCTSPSKEVEEMRKEIDGNIYTWFDYNYYIKETPMAKGRTKATLTPKIKLLEEEQWIETRLVQTGNGERKYVRILEKCDTLFRNLNDPVEKTKRTPFRKLNIDNNTTKNNYTIDKEETNSKELDSQIKTFISKWKSIDDFYDRLFRIPTERRASTKLIETAPEKQLNYILNNLEMLSNKKYCPDITKPSLLLKNWAKVVSFIKKESSPTKEDKGGGCLIVS